MKTIKSIAIALGLVLTQFNTANAFCGFYVAKADAKLFNESSQIIIVRDGNRSVITMSNDYRGPVKDFAMVIPVPEVLSRDNIRIANQMIFDKLDAYSGPRLVEYYDQNPCYDYNLEDMSTMEMSAVPSMARSKSSVKKEKRDYGVQIEATYTVGEYDILILSAKESDGLKRWLTDNDYKIPAKAEGVLAPYIRNKMKFFVVKVNTEVQKTKGFCQLRPLQIAFNSDKFMLPIRLGMANANGPQDMVVYAFTKKGRVETANYRTVKLPTDRNIPEFVQKDFGKFYVDLFDKAWKREGEKVVFLEYAWDVSFNNQVGVKCDPCVGPPPMYNDMREAGVFWLNNAGGTQVSGDVFFTRLHVRYDRTHFPQDLFFSATPNKQRFQSRYVMNHAIKYDVSCKDASNYYRKVLKRREGELHELANLTGWDISTHRDYTDVFAKKLKKTDNGNGWISPDFDNGSFGFGLFLDGFNNNGKGGYIQLLMVTLAVVGISLFGGYMKKIRTLVAQ